jgi:hypothetical protein
MGESMIRVALIAAMSLLVVGCSTITEGRSQNITVTTDPPGAKCKLERQGAVIANVDQTPGSVYVEKTKYDILITCEKDGYETATLNNHSGVAAATFGNIILGGGIGWAIDSATGSDNRYDSPVTITMMQHSPSPEAASPQ